MLMSTQLISPSFLFRFSAPCRYAAAAWKASGIELGEEHRLPSFAELDDAPQRVNVAAAWNEQGLLFTVDVAGKKQAPWCRESRIEESDGVFLWIDTRDTHNIHRASRFCHQFVFLPIGGGLHQAEPIAEMLLINRARENPETGAPRHIERGEQKTAERLSLGYSYPRSRANGLRSGRTPAPGFPLGGDRPRSRRAHLLLPARVAIS